jgi:hypothetical protein
MPHTSFYQLKSSFLIATSDQINSQEIVSDLLQIRQMRDQQRMPQPAEIAVVRVVHFDDSPGVTTTTDGFPVEHKVFFRADNSKGEEVLRAGKSYASVQFEGSF